MIPFPVIGGVKHRHHLYMYVYSAADTCILTGSVCDVVFFCEPYSAYHSDHETTGKQQQDAGSFFFFFFNSKI